MCNLLCLCKTLNNYFAKDGSSNDVCRVSLSERYRIAHLGSGTNVQLSQISKSCLVSPPKIALAGPVRLRSAGFSWAQRICAKRREGVPSQHKGGKHSIEAFA